MFMAARVHHEQRTDLSKWVDVFGILADRDVTLAFRPMGRIEAAAINEQGSERGVIVNASRPLHRQRFSAAHELGHISFGHETSVDLDLLIERAPSGQWTDDEKLAESFAAWFLMPHNLIERSLRRLGIERLSDPADVYQLSLRMGTSYESTARHLVNARFCSTQLSKKWLQVEPAKLKREAAGAFLPDAMRNDVHLLGRLDDGTSQLVRAGDRVVVCLEEKPTTGYRWAFDPLPDFLNVIDDSYLPATAVASADEPFATGGLEKRRFVLGVGEPPATQGVALVLNERRAWQRDPIARFQIEVSVETTERFGVPERYFKAA